MSEFYVKPLFRRRGLGEKCAEEILFKHPGNWIISFNEHNKAGRHLWKKLGKRLAGDGLEEGKTDNDHELIGFTLSVK